MIQGFGLRETVAHAFINILAEQAQGIARAPCTCSPLTTIYSLLTIYCLAMIMRISASLSAITSPLTSKVTLWIVPVNSKGVL